MKVQDGKQWQNYIKGGCVSIPEGIQELAPYALAEHRELTQAVLPKSLVQIGRHAFYNCRNLTRLVFWDSLKDIGDGAFKNCEAFGELVIFLGKDGSCAGLKSILAERTEAFMVYFKSVAETPVNSLYFPSYIHDYEENNEARIINQITYGIGVHYRECVRDGGIDYASYDQVFAKCIHLDQKAAVRIAFLRLRYPVELRREAQETYREWLWEHQREALKQLADKIANLRDFISLDLYRSEEEWNEAIDWLQKKGKWEAIGLLMQERKKRYGEKRNKFAF